MDLVVLILWVGIFNVLRHAGEKNKQFHASHSSDLFNYIIHTLGLREINLSGGILPGLITKLITFWKNLTECSCLLIGRICFLWYC